MVLLLVIPWLVSRLDSPTTLKLPGSLVSGSWTFHTEASRELEVHFSYFGKVSEKVSLRLDQNTDFQSTSWLLAIAAAELGNLGNATGVGFKLSCMGAPIGEHLLAELLSLKGGDKLELELDVDAVDKAAAALQDVMSALKRKNEQLAAENK